MFFLQLRPGGDGTLFASKHKATGNVALRLRLFLEHQCLDAGDLGSLLVEREIDFENDGVFGYFEFQSPWRLRSQGVFAERLDMLAVKTERIFFATVGAANRHHVLPRF